MRRLIWALLGVEAALATALAATPWLRAFHVTGTAAVLVAAAMFSVAVSVLTTVRWRQSPVASYMWSLAALVVFLLAAISLTPTDLARGLVHGPSSLLTATLPLTTPRWLLVTPVVATWLTGAAVSQLVTRAHRFGLAAAVLVGSYVGAYALSSNAPGQATAVGALLLVALALLAMSRQLAADLDRPTVTADDRAGTGVLRTLMGWVALSVAIAVVALLFVPVLPGMRHQRASVARAAPIDNALALAPVQAVASLRDTDPKAAPVPLFNVQTEGPSAGYYMLASLDQYDGDSWRFDRTFAPTGGRVPAPAAGSVAPLVPHVRQRYTITRSLGPALPFLPYMDRPIQVSGIAVDMHVESGMIVPAAAVRLPASYTVDSQAPIRTLDGVPPTSAVAAVATGSDRQLPADVGADLTGVVRYLAAVTGQRPAPTIPFLQSVVVALQKTTRRIDMTSTPNGKAVTHQGTSLSEVINAVTVSQQATPEQFATLFVVVARFLGVPARLATGFRVGDATAGPVGAGLHVITDRQAWTWAEIPVAGIGWVVADPTPQQTASGRALPLSGVQPPSTTVPPPQANAVPGNAPGAHALAPQAQVKLPGHGDRSPLWAIGAGGLLVLALVVAATVGLFGIAAARRAFRRRLRRSGDPAALAVGAWLELLDDLRCVGVVTSEAATSGEVAEVAGHQFGPELSRPVRAIGNIADQALCSSHVAVDGEAAQVAWRMERSLARQMRSQLRSKERARAALTVGGAPRRPTSRRSRGRPGGRAVRV